eukprot:SAG31_NODE_117_length_24022_cov_6.878067_16_plen_192_part_00
MRESSVAGRRSRDRQLIPPCLCPPVRSRCPVSGGTLSATSACPVGTGKSIQSEFGSMMTGDVCRLRTAFVAAQVPAQNSEQLQFALSAAVAGTTAERIAERQISRIAFRQACHQRHQRDHSGGVAAFAPCSLQCAVNMCRPRRTVLGGAQSDRGSGGARVRCRCLKDSLLQATTCRSTHRVGLMMSARRGC